MNHSTLPIYHLAILRGFLLATKADHEIFESLEGLYSSAVRGRAALDMLDEQVKAPDEEVAGQKPQVKAESAKVIPSKEERGDIDPSWTETSSFLPSCDAKKEEFKAEGIKTIEIPPESTVTYSIRETSLPLGVKESKEWPAHLIWRLFDEREKKPQRTWDEIAKIMDESKFRIQQKYSKMTISGEIALLRAARDGGSEIILPTFVQDPVSEKPAAKEYVPATIEKLQTAHNSYAGKRDDNQLVDSDWPDIKYRHVTLKHSNTSIAGDYGVAEYQMDTFIRTQKRKENLIAEATISGEGMGKGH